MQKQKGTYRPDPRGSEQKGGLLMPKEYRTIEEVAGPLMLVRGVQNVAYDELGEIELANGEKRRCKVLEIDGGNALVQLFESSTGINLESSKVRFLGRSMELGVSEDMLSRMFDGLGRPIDGGPEILPEQRNDINGLPMKPGGKKLSAGIYPDRNFAIDGLNTLVRGQKLPIFSASGLPHAISLHRSPDRQRCAERQNHSLSYLPQWELHLRKRISLWRVSVKQARSTGASCSSIWQTTRR